jgi:hypothetical protein
MGGFGWEGRDMGSQMVWFWTERSWPKNYPILSKRSRYVFDYVALLTGVLMNSPCDTHMPQCSSANHRRERRKVVCRHKNMRLIVVTFRLSSILDIKSFIIPLQRHGAFLANLDPF